MYLVAVLRQEEGEEEEEEGVSLFELGEEDDDDDHVSEEEEEEEEEVGDGRDESSRTEQNRKRGDIKVTGLEHGRHGLLSSLKAAA